MSKELLREFIRLSSLTESVGSIVNILGIPKPMAHEFHKMSSKHDFLLARAFLLWAEASHVDSSIWAEIEADRNSGLHPNSLSLVGTVLGTFKAEVGSKIVTTLRASPHLADQIKKSKSYGEIRKILADASSKSIADSPKVLLSFPDGYYWLRLETSEECDWEADAMQHCGSDSRGTLVSLRDRAGKPHVTMTVNMDTMSIYQIKGKQNELPVEKYWPYVIEFSSRLGPFRMRDSELSGKTGLGKLLLDIAPPPLVFTKSDLIKKMLQNPVIREVPWVLGALKTAGADDFSSRAEVDVAYDELMRLFKEAGFTAEVISSQLGEVFYDRSKWSHASGSIVPPFSQITHAHKSLLPQVVAFMSRDVGCNPNVSEDPLFYFQKHFPTLNQLYQLLVASLDVPALSPLSEWSFGGHALFTASWGSAILPNENAYKVWMMGRDAYYAYERAVSARRDELRPSMNSLQPNEKRRLIDSIKDEIAVAFLKSPDAFMKRYPRSFYDALE